MDNRTLIISLAITSFAISTLYVVYNFSSRKGRGSAFWASGFSILAMGFLLIGQQGILDSFFTVIVANILILLGYLHNLWGVEKFLEIRVLRPWHGLYIGGMVFFFPYFLYLAPDVNARIILISMVLAVISFESGYHLFKRRSSLNKIIAMANSSVYFFIAAYYVSRSVFTLIRDNSALLTPSTQTSIFFIIVQISLFINAVSFILLHSTSLEQSLKAKMDEVKGLNATKDKMFSIVGHDLKGPVSNIQVLAGMLNQADMGSGCVEIGGEELRLLNRSINGMSEILDTLLHWGKTQNGLLGRDRVRGDAVAATEKVLEQLRPLGGAKELTINLEVEEPTIEITWDPHASALIMRNLVQNAIKFSPRGAHIRCFLNKHETGLIFSVVDQGAGIHPRVIEDLKNKHLVQSTSGTEGEKGSGLGLQLCRELSHAMGGWLRFTNLEPDDPRGTGTLAEVYWPMDSK